MKTITKIIASVSIVLISFSGSAQEVKENTVPVKKSVEKQEPVSTSPKMNKKIYSKARPLKHAQKKTLPAKQISAKE
ncbi:MAG: hypothetical protein RI883_1298 [Bacteroidota bacterium]|jgi:hypothetical protein